MTKVKICGLMSAADAEAVNPLLPDLAGAVFARKSRHFVSHDTARSIRNALDSRILLTGVFVNAQIAEITALAEKGIIQIVQLHGQEDAAYLRNLRMVCTLPVIQAYSVRSSEDLRRAALSDADIVLLDNGAGGTGEAFDRSLLTGFSRPYFLAGGITPETAAEAAAQYHPYGIDVSSGVETGGRKDPEKMKHLVASLRQTGGRL